MEHTFKCGVVGLSNDGDGDAFLMHMRDGELADERRLIECIQGPLRRELIRTQRALCHVINKAGGEIRVPDSLLDSATAVSEWLIHRDESTGEIVLRTKV